MTKRPARPAARKAASRPVLLVTGLSGAGLSTALKTLEDLGYLAVDNLPLALLPALVAERKGARRPLAVGIDSRTWDFSADRLLRAAESLRRDKSLAVRLVFIDCRGGILQQRFTETRRPHPLAADRSVADGVAQDRLRTEPVRAGADVVIDTSDLAARDLKRILAGHFTLDRDPGMRVFVTSFGFKHGLPRNADLVFDARFLDNPYWNKALRPLSGRDAAIGDHIRRDKGYAAFFESLTGMLGLLLPRYVAEGRAYLTIAIGCTGGRHRSVFIAEELFRWIGARGGKASLRHRDIDKSAAAEAEPPPPGRAKKTTRERKQKA